MMLIGDIQPNQRSTNATPLTINNGKAQSKFNPSKALNGGQHLSTECFVIIEQFPLFYLPIILVFYS